MPKAQFYLIKMQFIGLPSLSFRWLEKNLLLKECLDSVLKLLAWVCGLLLPKLFLIFQKQEIFWMAEC